MNSLIWFRQGEFRSVLVILFLGAIVVFLQRWREVQLRPEPLSDAHRSALFAFAMDSDRGGRYVDQHRDSTRSSSDFGKKKNIAKAKKRSIQKYISHGEFDPNIASDEEWLLKGLTKKQLQILRNFQNAGGRFYSPLDLRKIYGWDSAWVEECIADAKISDAQSSNGEEFKKEEVTPVLQKIDLNACDTNDLKKIRGIGSYFASKVIGYREALGGYVSTNQMSEIYHMREEALKVLLENTMIQDSTFCGIRVNTSDREGLKKHPYISWKVANNIVAFREMHGKYDAPEDLLKTAFIDDEALAKLKPYICLDD